MKRRTWYWYQDNCVGKGHIAYPHRKPWNSGNGKILKEKVDMREVVDVWKVLQEEDIEINIEKLLEAGVRVEVWVNLKGEKIAKKKTKEDSLEAQVSVVSVFSVLGNWMGNTYPI